MRGTSLCNNNKLYFENIGSLKGQVSYFQRKLPQDVKLLIENKLVNDYRIFTIDIVKHSISNIAEKFEGNYRVCKNTISNVNNVKFCFSNSITSYFCRFVA